MSKQKTYPPYRVRSDGDPRDSWIVDAVGNDVVTWVEMSKPYCDIYSDQIMQIICDALNGKESA
jgi:hypothetical protein